MQSPIAKMPAADRLEMIVHGNPPLLVEAYTDRFKAETFGVRHAADGDEHPIAFERRDPFALDDAAPVLQRAPT